MGNLRSVTQAVEHVARPGTGRLRRRDRHPRGDGRRTRGAAGQGGMRDCMRELRDVGMLDAVLHAAAHKPLVGVGVGMQMLLDH